jgi:beta-glucosidase
MGRRAGGGRRAGELRLVGDERVSARFLFTTGIENSAPTLSSGVRVDEMEKCGHYERWEEDFALVRTLGLDALRYGPAYYRTHLGAGRYD